MAARDKTPLTPEVLEQNARDYETGRAASRENKYGEAERRFRAAADRGDAQSQFMLGLMYSAGSAIGFFNSEIASEWAEMAARQGHAEAMMLLVKLYMGKRGLEVRDFEKAYFWCKRAAKAGQRGAAGQLPVLREKALAQKERWPVRHWLTGMPNEREIAQIEQGVLIGDYESRDQILKMYEIPQTPGHRPRMRRWLTKLAERGYPSAQFDLFLMYHKGQCVRKDLEKAIFWLEKSAAQGLDMACLRLGEYYEDGVYVGKDLSRALEHYLRAAEVETEFCAPRVAEMYEAGEGTARSISDAVMWWHWVQARASRHQAECGEALARLKAESPDEYARGVKAYRKREREWRRRREASIYLSIPDDELDDEQD